MNRTFSEPQRLSDLQDALPGESAVATSRTIRSGRTEGRADRLADDQLKGQMKARVPGQTQGQAEGRSAGRANRRTVGRTDGTAPARQRAGATISLKGRALRLLTGREHSRLELERKLAPHEETPGELARILDDLQAKDFINEGRVVESVLHRRASRLGAARIKHELQNKGLTPEAVAQAVQTLKGTEVERAREIWRKKFNGPAENATELARHMRFLAARGFGGDVIRRVVTGSDDD